MYSDAVWKHFFCVLRMCSIFCDPYELASLYELGQDMRLHLCLHYTFSSIPYLTPSFFFYFLLLVEKWGLGGWNCCCMLIYGWLYCLLFRIFSFDQKSLILIRYVLILAKTLESNLYYLFIYLAVFVISVFDVIDLSYSVTQKHLINFYYCFYPSSNRILSQDSLVLLSLLLFIFHICRI